MSSVEITHQDVIELERRYGIAKENIDGCEFFDGYPVHCAEVSEFMLSLSGRMWGNKQYSSQKVSNLIDGLETATLLDCKSIFTNCSRGERFAPGHWLVVLKGDLIDRVIARVKELVPASD